MPILFSRRDSTDVPRLCCLCTEDGPSDRRRPHTPGPKRLRNLGIRVHGLHFLPLEASLAACRLVCLPVYAGEA